MALPTRAPAVNPTANQRLRYLPRPRLALKPNPRKTAMPHRPLPTLLTTLPAWLLLGLIALPAGAQTTVTAPWVRGTVAAQKSTGAFMQIQSKTGGKLVSISSPAAGVVEIHEMKMDGNTMQMRAISTLDLPAGQPVDLKPGGYHVMLLDLKAPLQAGDTVPLTLVIEAPGGKRDSITVQAPVRALGSAGKPAEVEHKH